MSISNYLILISVIFTGATFINPEITMYGMNTYFLDRWEYHIYFLQFFSSNFLHWDPMHLLFNSIFIYYFWNVLEAIIWRKKFITFFVFSVFFNWAAITLFSDWNTIWISWFAMALLAYYTLELKSLNNLEYKWGITALVINVWIWLHPQVSLIWHLAWAIWWVIFYLIHKDYLNRLLTPLKKAEEL